MTITQITEPHLDQEQSGAWHSLLERLNRQSVRKHFDAYADIEWDAPEFAIHPGDARWTLHPDHALGATDWYRNQPPDVQSRLGLHLLASQMKLGLEFENLLQRGILAWAQQLPNGSPEFRYAMHEVIEEGQHSLMFQEFVNRSGVDARGLPRKLRPAARVVVRLGRSFPELFFVFVLGGEDPIDHVQREWLRRGGRHPLLERIMRIHVTEEARHLSFARQYLRERVPRLSWRRRQAIALRAPVILGVMSRLMLEPPRSVVRSYGIPEDVLRAAYRRNPEHRRALAASLAKPRSLLHELGLVTPLSRLVWRAFGIWEEPAPRRSPQMG